MAVGDTFNGLSSVSSGSYLDIQPSGTVEAVIHNIYHSSDVQLEYFDGTNSVVFDSASGMGVYAKYSFHVTNAKRIRVKNTSGSAQLIGYDGIVTHT
jgi:hypothetical protein